MRRAAKVDETHGAIRDALRAAGCSVFSCGPVGSGVPDLCVSYRGLIHFGFTALVECKTGTRKPNPRQDRFAREWQGTVIVANSPEMAVTEFFNAYAAQMVNAVWSGD